MIPRPTALICLMNWGKAVMATDQQIGAVQRLLGPDANSDNGWDRTAIADMLDAGKSNDEIAYEWWTQRSADTADYVNVSESGSSRNLSTIHNNAVALAKMYGDRVDNSGGGGVTAGGGIRSFPMRRV